jgi:NAD(P)H-flavin reductase
MADQVAVNDPLLPLRYRVTRRRQELVDTFSLEMEPMDGTPLIRCGPGQFNMLYVYGVGEVPISLSGYTRDGERLIHTVRVVGPVTRAMSGLDEGDVLGVRGPYGTCWPLDLAEGRDVLFAAGGLGLAPLRLAIQHVLDNRSLFGNVCVFFGARSPELILFRHALERWRGRFDITVDVTVDYAGGDWAGKVGVVTNLLDRNDYDPEDTCAMICGPEVMMRYSAKSLLERGLDPDRIHLSMERNMKCAVGYCGHCQFGPGFVCRDGAVYRYSDIDRLLELAEL